MSHNADTQIGLIFSFARSLIHSWSLEHSLKMTRHGSVVCCCLLEPKAQPRDDEAG